MAPNDVKKQYRHLYTAPTDQFVIVEVPPLQYLAIDGSGDPNTSPTYRAAVEALYAVSYAIRFHCKQTLGQVHVVGPLEGLWPETIVGQPKTSWNWTMLIHQPEHVTPEMVALATEQAQKKRPNDAIDRLRLQTLEEGLAVQILHLGSYDNEAPTIRRMHEEFIPAQSLALRGRHHEIYLNDPRTTAPEKLRTIIRQPVERVSQPQQPLAPAQ